MADYSGAYEKFDVDESDKIKKYKELSEKLDKIESEKKVAKHSEPIVVKGTLHTGGFISNGSIGTFGGYGAQDSQRVSKRTIRSSKSYDEAGNLTFEEEEEIIEYTPVTPFQVTNVTQSSTTGEVE